MTNFIPRLDPKDVDNTQVRRWNTIQLNCLKKTVQVVEYWGEKIKLYRGEKVKRSKYYKTPLDNLIIDLLDNNTKDYDLKKTQLKAKSGNLGILVPVSDIADIKGDALEFAMDLLCVYLSQFSLNELIEHIKTAKAQNEEVELPYAVDGLLFVIEKWINLLFYSDDLKSQAINLGGWLSHCAADEANQPHFYQFISWFCSAVDAIILDDYVPKISSNYFPEVNIVIHEYREKLIAELKEIMNSHSKYFYFNSIGGLRKHLSQLLAYDYDAIQCHQLIMSDVRLSSDRANDILKKLRKKESFFNKLGNYFSDGNVTEKVKTIMNFKKDIDAFSLFDTDIHKYQDPFFSKSKLSSDAYQFLCEEVENYLATNSTIMVNTLESEYLATIKYTCDKFTSPLIEWRLVDDQLYPSLNLALEQDVENTKVFLIAKKKHEEKEAANLQRYLKALDVIISRTALDNLIKAVPEFYYQANTNIWMLAVKQAEEVIRYNQVFRNQKMIELGFDEVTDISAAQKEIYLSEMLAIEEEIQAYVPYVTSSFKSALPERRSTTFDMYRHASDGVEFDPFSTLDPEKWIRGNVMKSLKSTVIKGEVTQVNCFCLDLSGSMNNDRMRNLYKMLYLLVVGLQNRKSYDAFHFFSNNFIPGVDFTEQYTKKSLLLKVLDIVSEIQGPRVEYCGLEGTNISDGIRGCAERMVDFIDILEARNEKINISASMFVISDGEPNFGIRDLKKLKNYVQALREETNFAIKAIYIKSVADHSNFVSKIFGEDDSVETSNFDEGVQKFTSVMSKTYKAQRRQYKWDAKKEKLGIE